MGLAPLNVAYAECRHGTGPRVVCYYVRRRYLWYLHTTIARTFESRDEAAMISGSIKWKITINHVNIISLQLSFNLH